MIATTEKKIVTRKAPAEKANTYDEGFIAMGNDNHKYIVSVDKKGIKRWMKTKKDVFFEAPQEIVAETQTKPKRTNKKKEEIVGEQQPPEQQCVKPKRAYNKKVVKQYAEMATQTEEVKKERKPREPKN